MENSSCYWKCLNLFFVFLIEFLGLIILIDFVIKSDDLGVLLGKAPFALGLVIGLIAIVNVRVNQDGIVSIMNDFKAMSKLDEGGAIKEVEEFCSKWDKSLRIMIVIMCCFVHLQMQMFGGKYEMLYGFIIEIENDLEYMAFYLVHILQTFTISFVYAGCLSTYLSFMLQLKVHCEIISRKLRDILKPENSGEESDNFEKLKGIMEHHQDVKR